MLRHKQRALVRVDPTKKVKCRVIENGTVCLQVFADKENLRKHLCGRDGVSTPRKHSIIAIKLAYPKISSLITRKADSHRTLGAVRRKLSNALKERVNKRQRNEYRSDNASTEPRKKGRIGKKVRANVKAQ